MRVLVWVVHISKIIEVIFVFVNQWLKHLMWHLILLILWWWLETSWAVWIDLGQRFIFLCIFSKGMRVLVWIVHVSKIIEVIFILIDQRLQHLMWNFILLVFRWWLETSWAIRIDLYH